uniref:Uncharacterized protein n=2 Tax=Helianthus annuus TaxID=4232 RepID=A0A251TQR9_HELAN
MLQPTFNSWPQRKFMRMKGYYKISRYVSLANKDEEYEDMDDMTSYILFSKMTYLFYDSLDAYVQVKMMIFNGLIVKCHPNRFSSQNSFGA